MTRRETAAETPRRGRQRRTGPTATGAAGLDSRFAAIVAAYEADPRVARKRMFSSDAVLTLDGKIFAMFVRDRLVVKLPGALVAAGQAERFDPGQGRLMKEWASFATKRGWLALAEEAYAFVGGGGKPPAPARRRRR
ncbi:MAG TPA: hypothetical protein VEZ14_06710 [Dehalococcoidia bacterium]|nr:hypothetical protein [Dehalococcoidia bacterium]